jgi:hypothetical protein
MRAFRPGRRVFANLVFVLLLVAGCGDSNDQASVTVNLGTTSATFAETVVAETDRDVYVASSIGFASFSNFGPEPLSLPGCAPFVFEQRLDGEWAFVGPPYVCVWEGFAFAVAPNERDEVEFLVPNESGIYRLSYDYSSRCLPDLPLSQAQCEREDVVYSNEFDVERELCGPFELGCQVAPAAPLFHCPDGLNLGGPAGDCTRDPVSSECGYEFLSCP